MTHPLIFSFPPRIQYTDLHSGYVNNNIKYVAIYICNVCMIHMLPLYSGIEWVWYNIAQVYESKKEKYCFVCVQLRNESSSQCLSNHFCVRKFLRNSFQWRCKGLPVIERKDVLILFDSITGIGTTLIFFINKSHNTQKCMLFRRWDKDISNIYF